MNQDKNNLLQSFLNDKVFDNVEVDFEKHKAGSIGQNIRSGNCQVIDSRFQYLNCQLFLETKTSSGTWLVSLTKGFGSRKDGTRSLMREYGTRSLMNDLFHFARLRAQNDRDKVAGLAIVYRDKKNVNNPPLMSLRAQAALAVLKNWKNIQQGPLSVCMEASTYCETYKMKVGTKESEKELEDKLKDKLKENLNAPDELAASQLRMRLFSRTGREKRTSLAMDLVVMRESLVEVLELKKDYLGREAFVELLQNAFFPLSFSGMAEGLFKDMQEFPIADIPDKKASKEFKKKSQQAKEFVLRGVGKGHPVGKCNVSFEFELMKQQLLERSRDRTYSFEIIFV